MGFSSEVPLLGHSLGSEASVPQPLFFTNASRPSQFDKLIFFSLGEAIITCFLNKVIQGKAKNNKQGNKGKKTKTAIKAACGGISQKTPQH